MLAGLARAHPEALDPGDIHTLYHRRIGLLVRRGNPRRLLTLDDLAQVGIGVLEVQLEEMGEFHDRVPGLRGRLAASVRTGEDGIRAWRANPGLDTWITFESWHHAARDQSDFVPLPAGIGAARATVIAVTRWTRRRMLAMEFIAFLQGPQAHEAFRRHGWR